MFTYVRNAVQYIRSSKCFRIVVVHRLILIMVLVYMVASLALRLVRVSLICNLVKLEMHGISLEVEQNLLD